MEDTTMKIMSFLAGAMSGAVVGATAALLLAPASGEDLRLETRRRYESILAEARQAAADKQAELKAQLEELRKPRRGMEEEAG
jgi:gas vesicle protein